MRARTWVPVGLGAAALWIGLRRWAVPSPGASQSADVRHNRVRAFNHAVLNPLMLAAAARFRGTYPAVIHHRGRRSGSDYATPVVAQPVPGGFVVPLPYGRGTDWCRNVRAAGGATIDRGGRTFTVGQPELLTPAQAGPLLDDRHRRTWNRFGIEEYLLLHDRDTSAPSVRSSQGVAS